MDCKNYKKAKFRESFPDQETNRYDQYKVVTIDYSHYSL